MRFKRGPSLCGRQAGGGEWHRLDGVHTGHRHSPACGGQVQPHALRPADHRLRCGHGGYVGGYVMDEVLFYDIK